MGKFAKFCLIAAAIMIGLGIFVGTIVTAVGGRNIIRNVANEGVASIGPGGLRLWDWSFGWPWSWSWGGSSWSWSGNNNSGGNIGLTVNGSKVSGQLYESSVKAVDINSLDITVGIGDFRIIPWENDYFQIEIDGIGKCKYYSQGATLYVEGFDLNGRNVVNINNRLRLYVPEDVSYDRIRINVGVGALEIRDLATQELNTDVGVGSLTMTDMMVNRLNLTNSVGETTFKGEVNGDISVECSIGSVSLRLNGEYEDFDYAINCALGNISIGRYSYSALVNESRVNNNADKKMRLECSIGNIDVSFY